MAQLVVAILPFSHSSRVYQTFALLQLTDLANSFR
jgi:hypothetical protein